jgi:predicted nucleic acid-binding protein
VLVLIDTNILSLALRRAGARLSAAENALTVKFGELIREDRVRLIGPIRQELLSGIREPAQFEQLRLHLRSFPDEVLTSEDFEQAAQCNNRSRSKGITGPSTDFLICAVALRRGWQVFTTDAGFNSYAKVLPLALFPHSP